MSCDHVIDTLGLRSHLLVLVVLLLVALMAHTALGQCMLANPSFEISGTGGATFAGWNQFESVGSSANATHGSVAARVSGPNHGGWDVSGYWQPLDTAPGERWAASVKGWHSAANPLTGQSRAILNIEWRNAGGGLISYESHTVADASTPVDEIQEFYVESGPAPAGTVKTRLLLGVLQSPTDPPPDVFYDQATFDNLGPPTLDALQWSDFSGGRTVDFAGLTWRVKGPGYYGPGPSLFCYYPSCTWVDVGGHLHMTIKNTGGSWYSTEVTLKDPLGYGDYIFTTLGRLDQLDPNAVLGLYLWQYGPCYAPENGWWNPYNEIDVEFSRWGNPASDLGQFVAQPYDYPGNISRFGATFSDGELTSHAFRWLPNRVEFRSWRGGPEDEAPENLIHAWTYTGPHIPRPEQPRVHINLWQFNGPPSTNQEVVIDQFTFVPAGGVAGIPVDVPVSGVSHLSLAAPNPFSAHTTIRYDMRKGGNAEIVVYDVLGRPVRVLVSGFVQAGDHDIFWDGRDDSGERVAPGAYLYQLRTDDVVETRKFVVLK
jgi:hypothetical protein